MSREYDSTYEGQLQKCGDERSALEQTVDDLSEENQHLRAEVARLTAERDEARRISCASSAELRDIDQPDDMTLDFRARRIAADRGWDCFKEAKP